MDEVIINSQKAKEEIHQIIDALWQEHRYLRVEIKTGKQRTDLQNRSLHLYFRLCSAALNAAGHDMVHYFGGSGVSIPWDKEGRNFKELVWRPIQEVVTGFASTKEPLTKQYDEIYQVVSRHLASEKGVSVAWPSKEQVE